MPRTRLLPPPVDWLADYAAPVGGDLYASASEATHAAWGHVAASLATLGASSGADKGAGLQDQIERQIADIGLGYRMAGDADERLWPLTPMPIIIGADEWAGVEQGLIQRARLLEAVAADAHGPGQLVASGLLPATVLAGSPYFTRKMIGVAPPAGRHLHVYAVDLARGDDGRWLVLADRVRMANGIGYALGNRLALTRATGAMLGDVHARRHAGFFGDLREGLARDCPRERPRIALMTPGRLNQSYGEQAHLARYLGFPLVEGRDLVVADDRLYVRTIAGPKRVDALWRWLDTSALDPLSFDARSAIGVADLFSTLNGGAMVANWPGVEVVESRAMAAHLPMLCRQWLGEEPILPGIDTRWCASPGVLDQVAQELDSWLIAPAFGQAEALPDGPVAGRDLNAEQRAALLAAMHLRPMDYCAQAMVQPATTPVLDGDRLVARPFTLRAFVARDGTGNWVVMPGGFARILSDGASANPLIGNADLSADVCIVDAASPARAAPTMLAQTPPIQRGGGILASQSADNLFWFSRYAERAEITLRILRAILGSSIEADGTLDQETPLADMLVHLLVLWGAIDAPMADEPLEMICASALGETDLAGGVAALVRRAQETGLTLRQRFARDFWRMASRPMPAIDPDVPQSMLYASRELIERFSALSGQVAENMVRGPAYAFLDMGRRLERALSICRITRHLSAGGDDALSLLLDLCDSQITYRSRYLSGPSPLPVLDLILLDPDNPRSLAFQLGAMVGHIANLPPMGEDGLPEQVLREARAALCPLQTLSVEEIDAERLQEIETRLMALSDAISARYFLPSERVEQRLQGAMLG